MARRRARERLRRRGELLAAQANAPTARATIGVTALGAIAISIVQALQTPFSGLNPRPEVFLLFAALVAAGAAAFASFTKTAAERKQAQEEHDRKADRLEAARGTWRLGDLEQLNPIALGIFPPDPTLSPAGAGLPPYVERPELDRAIDAALERDGLVLLVGPARVGKTRSAYQGLARRPPEGKLIAPASGPALAIVAELDAAELLEGVLWLDDFDRFIDHLDEPHFTTLLQGWWPAIATVRSDVLDEMLEGSGERAVKAKRAFAAATVIGVPEQLVERKAREKAELLFPGRDAARGIGRAVAAPHTELPAGESFGGSGVHAASIEEPRPREPLRHPPNWVLRVAAAITAVLLVAFVLVASDGGFFKDSVADVVEDIRHDHAAAGRPPLAAFVERLRGPDGHQAHVFVFGGEGARSDEVAIYDERGDSLDRRPELVFRPRPGRGQVFRFSNPFLGEGFRDGTKPLLGAFELRSLQRPDTPGPQVPVAVKWDDGSADYEVFPLLPDEAPVAMSVGDTGVITLRNESSNGPREVRGAAVSVFAVAGANEFLVTGTVPPTQVRQDRLEVVFYGLEFRSKGGVRATLGCTIDGQETFTQEGPPNRATLEAAYERWAEQVLVGGDSCAARRNSLPNATG